MRNQQNGGPAFPRPASINPTMGTLPDGDAVVDDQEGMSLRDYLAAKAIQGLLANPGGPIQANGMSGFGWTNTTDDQMAALSYQIADAMLRARKTKPSATIVPKAEPSEPLMKRTPLRRMSKKRRKLIPARKQCLADVSERAWGLCEAKITGVCTGRGCDGHEILKRSHGGSITDPGNVIWICRACHNWIHANPAAARERGLLK